MQQRLRAAALLTFCLAASACAPTRVQVPLPIPAERMDCEVLSDADGRPKIMPERVIDWTKVTTVDQARQEHEAYVARIREREAPVAAYVVRLEGRVFACADDAQWLRDYVKALPTP